MPDITTISMAPAEYPDLLANLTTAPTEPVSTKVGKAVLSKPAPATNAEQEGYLGKATPKGKEGNTTPSTGTSTPATKTGTSSVTAAPTETGTSTVTAAPVKKGTTTGKTGIVTPAPKSDSVQGEADSKPKDCATGWEQSTPTTRKLRESAVSGRELEEKLQTKRQLEASANKDIAKLEAYFGWH
ncbi:Transglutaminase elicitor M81C [Phytophthora cinnamomi]|uniref:Transglutaminase elicitor M81C n=1 Tax=Phytophthora cinnamomi TaxID=4785 RepID=UPI00355A0273|nr:Transglutaminase elicitor M81C [Phytophthora cinnamomi]